MLYIMSTGAGLAQNDRQLVDIRVGGEEPASALITTQAATPIHRMDVGMAVQHVTMTVSAGSVLEYIPDHVVPYGGSRSHLSLEAIVSSGGCAIVSDCVTAGRLGRGERHSYDVLSMETQISQRLRVSSGHNGLFRNRVRPLARDRGVFSPHTGGGLVGMRNFGAWANVWIIAPSSASTLSVLEAVRELPTPASSGTLRWAASTLPYESGVWVRILSATAEEAREARDAVWTTARMVLLGASAPRLRKY